MPKQITLDKQWIYQQHFEKNRSIPDIARELKVSAETVRKNLIRLGYCPRDDRINYKNIFTKKYLEDEYVNKGRFAEDIAKENNVTADAVRRHLMKHNIPIRDDRIGKFSKILTKQYLIKEYVENKKSAVQIAEELGISKNSRTIISRALNVYGIKDRNPAPLLRTNKNYVGWKGYKELSGTLYNKYKRGAEKRGLEFNVTPQFLWDLFIKQNRKCALSGIEIYFSKTEGRKRDTKEITASLDRIDSNKGYTEDNVQWVHKKVNTMKMQMEEKEFISFCKEIAKYNS